MDRFDRSQTSRSDAKPQKNKARPETSTWRKQLLGGALAAGLFGAAVGNGIPDLSRPEHASSNLHLPESHNLTKYTSTLPIPEYLKKFDNPVAPKDALSPRNRELDKKASQSLNTTNGVEHILQDKEFQKNIILACQNSEFAKDCVVLAKKQGFVENFKQDEHARKLLSELCQDREFAEACGALAKNQEIMGVLQHDRHFMKLLSELCQDPEFALTCVALAKNNKPLDNGNPPLNVTDVNDNLNATQEKAHSRNSDTTQKNIKGQQRPGRKLLSIQESEGNQEPEKPTLVEKLADRYIDSHLPQRLPFAERITEKQLGITEKHLQHTNMRDNIFMGCAATIIIMGAGVMFNTNNRLNKHLEAARGDKDTLKQELFTMAKERDDLKREKANLIDPKELEALKKELEALKNEKNTVVSHNTILVQKNEILGKEKQEALQAGEKLFSDNSQLKLEREYLVKEKQVLQENHQKEIQKLKEENQTLTAKYNNLELDHKKLIASYQQALTAIAPHERQRIIQPMVGSSSSVPAPWGNFQ